MILQNKDKTQKTEFIGAAGSTDLAPGEELKVVCSQLPEQRVLSAGKSAMKLAGATAIGYFVYTNRKKIQDQLEKLLS